MRKYEQKYLARQVPLCSLDSWTGERGKAARHPLGDARALVQERHRELEEEDEAAEIRNKECQVFSPWFPFPPPVVIEISVQGGENVEIEEGPQEKDGEEVKKRYNDQSHQGLQHSHRALVARR